MECVKTIFLEEIKFKKPIPLVLVFKPAWETLKAINELKNINADIVDWIPHPSNPGKNVLEFLKAYEEGKCGLTK